MEMRLCISAPMSWNLRRSSSKVGPRCLTQFTGEKARFSDLEDHFAANMGFCPNWQESTANDRIVPPNLNSMVFLKAKKDVEGIVIDDGKGESSDLIDLTSGSQVLINYKNVASLVKNGDVHLI